jgi:Methyltransferase domain
VAEPSLRKLLSTGSPRARARWAIRIFTPWGIEWVLWKRSREKARHRVLAAQTSETMVTPSAAHVEGSIRFLVERGLDAIQVREGSMPAQSLEYLAETILDRLPADRPLRALHVGNFVGVSLVYITWLVSERHPESLVVSIDPNVQHREVENPQSHVFALLDRFNMLSRNLIINGYTLGRSADEALTEEQYASAAACENVLRSLHGLAGSCFDLVVIDGDHDEDYLSREIDAIRGLLTDGGIVVLDDITDWPGVAAVFKRVSGDDSFVKLGDDGRIGILQRQS